MGSPPTIPKMVESTIDFANRQGIAKKAFEFQMLYGIRVISTAAREGRLQHARFVPYGNTGILTS